MNTMDVHFTGEHEWDSDYMAVKFAAQVGDKRVLCRVSREALNDIPQTKDTREKAMENFVKLRPWVEQIARGLISRGRFDEQGGISITSQDVIEQQAMDLAKENKKVEPTIEKVYWFPDDKEVHLVELSDNMVRSLSGDVEPFYFGPSLVDNLPKPTGVDLIRTDEFGKLRLPEDWGGWDAAKELVIDP